MRIDTTIQRFAVSGEVTAVADFETGEVKTDKVTGYQTWQYPLTVFKSGERKAPSLTVKVQSAEPLDVAEGDFVELEDLQGNAYTLKDGKSGISYRAAAIALA